jgi:neurotrimin
MGVEDNMKWSIEKPTAYSWRLRIKALEVNDEGNYTCFVTLNSNNNRVEANRTVMVTGRSCKRALVENSEDI